MNSRRNQSSNELNKKYDIGAEFKFFRLDRGYIPQHLYDRLERKKIDLSAIDSSQTVTSRGENGEEPAICEINNNSQELFRKTM
jgi:hypothetical protein